MKLIIILSLFSSLNAYEGAALNNFIFQEAAKVVIREKIPEQNPTQEKSEELNTK